MVTSNRPIPTARVVAATTENSVTAPSVNDDATAKQADPDVQNKIDLLSLLCQKEKSLKELWNLHSMLSFDLNFERLKTKSLEKDQTNFRASCKTSANQVLCRLNLEIGNLKDAMKTQEQTKQNLLKSKDIKCKETLVLYCNNMRSNMKLVSTVAGLQ
jgi:hypothetical protein